MLRYGDCGAQGSKACLGWERELAVRGLLIQCQCMAPQTSCNVDAVPKYVECAVQGSKACLGWEREPAQGTYACTIVVDMWLQLLQHALHASHVLPAVPAPLDPRLSASFGILAGMESQVAASVAEHNAALQNLLGQMLTHWRVWHFEGTLGH